MSSPICHVEQLHLCLAAEGDLGGQRHLEPLPPPAPEEAGCFRAGMGVLTDPDLQWGKDELCSHSFSSNS